MIAFIRGTLVSKSPTLAVVENNGVAFEVLIPLSTFEALGDERSEVRLLTHLHVREDALTLFGFATEDERELFRLLLSVSGIGPKLALSILSGSRIEELYRNIADGNESALLRVKGLGKKTAQRLLIDLREKAQARVGATARPEPMVARQAPQVVEEAILAMMSLGYSKDEAERTIVRASAKTGENATVEELVRAALSG